MRQTGGLASGETSTRSRPCTCASRSAWSGVMIPSWPPSGPMTRISRARILSLTLSFFSMVYPSHPRPRGVVCAGLRADGPLRLHGKHPVADRREGRRAQVALAPAAHRHGARLRLAVPDHQHERDLLELGIADLGADLFVALVG